MSMTYYAVTDDPNELVHWGIKGMKWGVRHDKPRHAGSRHNRSAAYKKAQSKLGKMMKSGIKKAEAHWKAYNSPKAKEARFMKKAMQEARTGTLKYGKLTDDQVRRVTERLALERNARQLGSTENPSYSKRIKTAIGEGIVRGFGLGTASYIDARMRGRGETTAAIKKDKRMAKYENSLAGQRAERRKAKAEQRKEFYKEQAEKGNLHSRAGNVASLALLAVADPRNEIYKDERARIKDSLTQKGRAKLMAAKRSEDKELERVKRQQEAKDKAYYTNYGKLEAEKDVAKLYGTASNSSGEPKAIVKRTATTTTTFTHQPTRDRDNRPTVRKTPRKWPRNGKR